MSKKPKNRMSDKFIRFSIGAKLVTIITILVLISLGAITFLVSYFVSKDLEISAEVNNFDINWRSSAEAEYAFSNVRSNAQVLIQIIADAGLLTPEGVFTPEGVYSDFAKRASDYYFSQNEHIAGLVIPVMQQESPEERELLVLVNEEYFLKKDIDASVVETYAYLNSSVFERAAAGSSIFLNATPYFSDNMLALFFHMEPPPSARTGGSLRAGSPPEDGAYLVLFSPEHLQEIFSFGVNQSYLINNDGDILIHSDNEMVSSNVNIADHEFIKKIRESNIGSRQDLVNDDGVDYFIAFSKMNDGACIAITSVEYNKIFEGIQATTRRNLMLTAAVVFLSILFIWFFSKTISTALKMLSNAARRIEGGFFDLELKPRSRDEIGYLTSSFQRMSKALNIFGRFTNREIAIKAMRGEIKPGGLPKHATIFFSDIRGFTEKSESFTNEFKDGASDRIVQWLNNYLTQMVECLEKTNGVVDKFIGDAVMAHWGTAYSAGSPAKDAFNGVKAALMMRKALVQLNKNRLEGDKGDPPINIGCGINTGIVTAGQIGSDIRMEYTVIGDPVNLASRIEALNKPLGTDILISESTYNLVKYFFITEEMPSVTVKGKEKPVKIFAVINHVSVTSGPKTLKEVRKLLGIKPPDLSKVDINSEEVKYKIGAGE